MEKMGNALQNQELQGAKSRRRMDVASKVVKAVVVSIFAGLAIWQVAILVEEHLSHSTQTLQVMEDADVIQAPAFTFCPKPSVKISALGADGSARFLYLSGGRSKNSTVAEDFKKISVSLPDVLLFAPIRFPDANNKIVDKVASVNGETIHVLDSGIWSERTFAYDERTLDPIGASRYKCFTLLPVDRAFTEVVPCSNDFFLFDFRQLPRTFQSSTQIEMFIHDRNEEFSFLGITAARRLLLRNNTLTGILLRPEVMHRQSRVEDLCIPDEDYSYSRCMEICFWEIFNANPDVPCVVPSLLPKEVAIVKPECKTAVDEARHTSKLKEARRPSSMYQLMRRCDCPKRCTAIEYQVSADPTPTCEIVKEGVAILTFSFPSKLVSHFLEREMLSIRDLLIGIGGIVGFFIGVSLIAIFVIQLICCKVCCKLFSRRNEVLDVDKH